MKTAIVLMAYGSPSRLEDVPAYLEDIRGGRSSPPGVLQHLIERYRGIGGSPLNEITERQRAALEHELRWLPVFVGMKHWTPRIADAVEQALAGGAERIIGLVLAPHYSKLSIGGYRARLEEALADRAELEFIDDWSNWEPFVEVVADRLRGTEAHVVFTAHSLPERVLEGDPYETQIRESGRLIAERAGLEQMVSRLSERKPRPAASGSAPTSSGTSTTSKDAASSTCWSRRSVSSPTTWRSSGTSTSRRENERPSSASSSSACRL